MTATNTQPTDVKALAHKVLHRNRQRNQPATQSCTAVASTATEAEGHATDVERYGLTLADLKAVAGPDWSEVQHNPALLDALARALRTRRLRERGEVPAHYTAVTVCEHCGPVPIFQGVPEKVAGCPWCFNRIRGLTVPKATKDE